MSSKFSNSSSETPSAVFFPSWVQQKVKAPTGYFSFPYVEFVHMGRESNPIYSFGFDFSRLNV